MKNIYLPVEDISEFKCYSIYNQDTIRVYYDVPKINSSSEYIDFYINSHYLEKTGNQTWGNYASNLPICINSSSITNNYLYRNDLSDILISFIILAVFCIYFPITLFFKLIKKGRVL